MVPYRVPPPATAPAAPAPPAGAPATRAPSVAGPGVSPAPARPLLVAALVGLLLAGCAAVESSAPGGSGVPAAAAAGTPDTWPWHMPQCVGYDATAYRAPSHRLAVTSQGATVREVYEPGWATRAMAEIRQVVAACGSYESGGRTDPAAFREQNAVVDDGFAGDESLLVRTTRLTPPRPAQEWFVAVVRRGDEVVTVRAASRDGAVRAAAHPEAGG